VSIAVRHEICTCSVAVSLARIAISDLTDGTTSESNGVMMSTRRDRIHLDSLRPYHPSSRPVHQRNQQKAHHRSADLSVTFAVAPNTFTLPVKDLGSRSRTLRRMCSPRSSPHLYTRSAYRNKAGPQLCYSASTDVGSNVGLSRGEVKPPDRCEPSTSVMLRATQLPNCQANSFQAP
jgi:hypothetical protein